MAKTLFELAQEYLNQGMPDITQTPRVTPPGTLPPITLPPQDPNAPTARISPMPQGGGGGDFGVYNPDPNSTRTQSKYSPYDYRQASERSYIGAPGDYSYSSGTEAQKMMDNFPDYYKGKQLTGIPGAAATYLKNSLPGRIMGGVANLANKYIPVNQRAIMENEMVGAGFALDDIGRIVQGGGAYDTAENVMSGYNANQLTEKSFDKRLDKITETMNKPGYKGNLQKRFDAITEAKKNWQEATGKSTTVFNDKSLEKDPTYISLADKIAIENNINLEKENDENNIFAANDKIVDPNITSNIINEFGFGGEYGSADDIFPSAPPTTVDMMNEFGYGGEYGSADDNFSSAPVATPTVDQLNEFGYGGGYGSSDDNFPGSPIATPTAEMINEFGYGQSYGSSDDNFPSNPITTPGITPTMLNEFGYGGGYGSSDDNFPSSPVATPTAEMINEFGYGGGYGSSDDNFPSSPVATPTAEMINEFGFGGNYGSSDDNFPSAPNDYDSGSGYNSTGQGGPAGQGSITNPSNYGTGSGNLGDYQMQPSTPTYQTGTTQRPGSGGGGGGSSSGGGKGIVCTMMNDFYGFGSFRNKIWLEHSKSLAPEYQKGYHKIFLPLVAYARKDGVTNKIVRKTLEHIAVHRTIDIRQEARGKVHLLGRLYRKILEPLCYLVGKHG